ncbi:hypothetical protein ACFW0P_16130 [Lysobacter soli]|uniref:hypothetical protein n=1 Tax=Lysobacter soli TaxID=453783 RepID=UPI0036CFF57F
MNNMEREKFKGRQASSSKVRSDTVRAVQPLTREQIERLEDLVRGSKSQHRAYHGVYREEALSVEPASMLRSKSK